MAVTVLSSLACPGETTSPKAVGIVVSRGATQSGIAGNAVSSAPAIKVVSGAGQGVAGIAVEFTVGSGAGTVSGGTATTNADGIATVGSWTLGKTAGANTLIATSTGLTGSPITFEATGFAGSPSQIVILTQPAGAEDGYALTTQPVVQLRDVNDNVTTTATNSVTAAVATGNGTLSGTTTISAIAGVAAFTNLTLAGVGTDALRFTATGLTAATSASFATAAAIALNLTIDGLYLTQSTQSYQGAVPLVAGRGALLRVFLKSNRTNVAEPLVRVRLYLAGHVVQTYTITPLSASVPMVIDEGSLVSSWNVAIPSTVMQPGLSVLADVDPTGAISETPKTDNSFPASGMPMPLDVRTVPQFQATLVPVLQTKNSLVGDVSEANKDSYMDYANRVYPFSGYDAAVHSVYSYTAVPSAASYDSTWTRLLAEINAMRATEGSSRNYYGVIKPSYNSGGTGFGYIGVPAAIGVDWTPSVQPSTLLRSMTAAHEWGHNFDRRHVNCGSPSTPDLAYPYAPTSVGTYGYDLSTNQVFAPAAYAEFMSYCKPLWISDYTYRAVIDYMTQHGGPALAVAPQHSLLVWGRIGPDGVVLEPAFEIEAPPSLPARSGPYSVRATDDAGREIFNLSFEGDAIDHAPNERQFAFVVPLSAAAAPTALRLFANGRESLQRSLPPSGAAGNSTVALASVRLSATAGSRTRLEWDATTYPVALVRDPATGQVLSFARGGAIDIAMPGRELDVTFSDGVRSVRRRLAITPR